MLSPALVAAGGVGGEVEWHGGGSGGTVFNGEVELYASVFSSGKGLIETKRKKTDYSVTGGL